MKTKTQTPEEFYAWLQKFDKKFTTDETFTPPEVYHAVQEWVCKRYNVDKESIIRPFYPEGDYVNEDYSGKVVVDNPPFSVVAQIVQFYMERDVPFFLFCPYLTAFGLLKYGASVVAQRHGVTYANGANVATGFVTNMEPFQKVFTNIELKQAVEGGGKREACQERETPTPKACTSFPTLTRLRTKASILRSTFRQRRCGKCFLTRRAKRSKFSEAASISASLPNWRL